MELKLRILQLDLARQKENMAFIKKYIDFAKEWNYTHVLFYLENAVRTKDTPFFNKEETYSEEEILEMVSYANEKGIDIIPAFENLGHQEKFLMYKELEDFSEITDYRTQGRGFHAYERGTVGCLSNPKFIEFIDKYIFDVASLFTSPYIHMGLDEPFDFAVCDKCRARLEKGETKSQMFLDHILRSHKLCKRINKRMMMWDDFFEYADVIESLPRDIIMCNWNYSYIAEEPNGHWTNRIKRDWFKYYQDRGFDYMFCVYAHRASSTYNLETFTKYGAKHSPLGAIMTTWCRNDSFYEGAMPFIAYGGSLWAGKVKNKEDAIDVYAKLLGSKTLASVVYNNTSFGCSNWRPDEICENDVMLRYVERKTQSVIIPIMESEIEKLTGEQKDIAEDIYSVTLNAYMGLKLAYIAEQIFDRYESGKEMPDFSADVKFIKDGYTKIKAIADRLWQKNRPDILSCGDSFNKKYEGIFKNIENLEKRLSNIERGGVLSVEYMLPEIFLSAEVKIKVKHKGEEEVEIYSDRLSPSVSGYDVAGCFTYRFKIKNKPVEYVKFGVFKEGAYYPVHFRCLVNGVKYVVDNAECVSGVCKDLQNLKTDDARFAMVGVEDGIAHFNDIDLGKPLNEIKVTFKKL